MTLRILFPPAHHVRWSPEGRTGPVRRLLRTTSPYISRRSRTGTLRCGLVVARLRREVPSGWCPARLRRITRCHTAVTNSADPLEPEGPGLRFRACPGSAGGPCNLCQVVPKDGPGIRTGAFSGLSKRYCRVFDGVSLTRQSLSRSRLTRPGEPDGSMHPRTDSSGTADGLADRGRTLRGPCVFLRQCGLLVALSPRARVGAPPPPSGTAAG